MTVNVDLAAAPPTAICERCGARLPAAAELHGHPRHTLQATVLAWADEHRRTCTGLRPLAKATIRA